MEDILKIAEQIARESHKGQKRWDGKPYITHSEAVESKFQSEEFKVVAILHDVLEDTNLQPEDLESKGIPRNLIQSIVYLTRLKEETYLDYILRVREDQIAERIKIEDIKHNLSTIKHGSMKDKYLLALYILETR